MPWPYIFIRSARFSVNHAPIQYQIWLSSYSKMPVAGGPNANCTLEESLEIMEVFDFLSNFMLLHILAEPYTILSWRGKLCKARHREEAADFILDPSDTLLINWLDVMEFLQPYLTPFDIVSLSTDGEITVSCYAIRCL
ncbi:hypothetical protein FE257_004304 [Aspergillus nanangensis]|uniref:Uncharacterized protein n=1 Tax=Aspergillus nanangensis TaxID=2582783 RepID=A0AAD4CAU3_ASPNN|nr:hypothetical protein FE257_004304 [Aspergillus nanangensis]